jgi:hypothetical protein
MIAPSVFRLVVVSSSSTTGGGREEEGREKGWRVVFCFDRALVREYCFGMVRINAS